MREKIEAVAKEFYGSSFIRMHDPKKLDADSYTVEVVYRWMNQETYQEEIVTNNCLILTENDKYELIP
jgi:hypothetical protein